MVFTGRLQLHISERPLKFAFADLIPSREVYLTNVEEEGEPEVVERVSHWLISETGADPGEGEGEEGGAQAGHAHQAPHVQGGGCGRSHQHLPPAQNSKKKNLRVSSEEIRGPYV